MTHNIVTISGGDLIVEPTGLDKLWSFTRQLTIPVTQVRGATHDPGIGHTPKGWRGPGLRIGKKLAGTFHDDGQRQFWNVAGFDDAVVIQLAPGAKFNRLILSVEHPDQVVAQINTAIHDQ